MTRENEAARAPDKVVGSRVAREALQARGYDSTPSAE